MLIGIYTYDKYELCITILESITQFAEYTGCSLRVAKVTISKAKHNKIDYIIVDGKRRKIEFINEEEN